MAVALENEPWYIDGENIASVDYLDEQANAATTTAESEQQRATCLAAHNQALRTLPGQTAILDAAYFAEPRAAGCSRPVSPSA